MSLGRWRHRYDPYGTPEDIEEAFRKWLSMYGIEAQTGKEKKGEEITMKKTCRVKLSSADLHDILRWYSFYSEGLQQRAAVCKNPVIEQMLAANSRELVDRIVLAFQDDPVSALPDPDYEVTTEIPDDAMTQAP